MATLGTQFVCLPLLSRALGVNGFAAYLLLNSFISWLSLANVGVTPALALFLARDGAADNTARDRQLISSAFAVNIAICSLIIFLFSVGSLLLSFHPMLASRLLCTAGITKGACYLVLAIFIAHTLLGVFEAAVIGKQKQHLLNAVQAAVSLPTVAGIYIGATQAQSPAIMTALVYMPAIVGRTLFVWSLIHRNHALAPKYSAVNRKTMFALLVSGGQYALAGTAAHLLAHVFPVTLVGITRPSAEVASCGSIMTLFIMFSGIFTMLIGPAVPIWTKAWHSSEHGWVRRGFFKLLVSLISAAALIVTCSSLLGAKPVEKWLGGAVQIPQQTLAWAGIYLLLSTFERVLFSLLVSTGAIKPASLMVFFRSLLGFMAMSAMVPTGGAGYIFPILALSVLLIDLIPLSLLALHILRKGGGLTCGAATLPAPC